jgi:hypothetical protein
MAVVATHPHSSDGNSDIRCTTLLAPTEVTDIVTSVVTQKKIERGSGVDRKFDFLNRCSDGRSETADAKISSKRDHFTIHMHDSEVRWVMYE